MQVQKLCSAGDFNISRGFEVKKRNLFSAQDSRAENTIEGESRGATPQDIFKKLGSATVLYHSIKHDNVLRSSLLSFRLRQDHFEPIDNLSIGLIKQLCTDSVYRKANIFKVQTSKLISTNVERSANCIEGEFRAALIYDQSIRWGRSDAQAPFSLSTISVFCSCKYFNKETVHHGFCCKHIIGQLRRVLLHNSTL